MLHSLIFIIVAVWVLLSLMLYLFQPKFIYFPHNDIEATPDLISLDYEDLILTTSDGVEINAWWIPNPNARATLLFLHGNAGNISHRLESIKIFYQLSLSVLIIDYRGFGKSTSKPSEQGTYIDAETAWHYLLNEKKINPDEIIIFGRSLGGGVATWLAEKYASSGLIIESSFTSIADIGRHYYPYLPTRLLARIKYPLINRMSKIRTPVLIIHSADDEVVPYKFGRQLFDEALKETTRPKIFLDIVGGHNDGFLVSSEKYINGIDHFITDIVQK